jgi:hypothetical protein
MKKTYTLLTVAILIGLTPLLASADINSGITAVGGLINNLTNSVVKSLVTLFATAAMAAFFFGVVQFIWASREGDSKKMEDGKDFMLWSVVALFVMFSIWGIITFFQTTFGVTQNNINIPTINVNGGGGNGNGGNGGGGNGGGNLGVGADCAANSDCNSGLTCVAYKCAAGGGGGGGGNGVGADCAANSDCNAGLSCNNFKCAAGGGGGSTCSQKTTLNECSAANCTWNDVNGTCQ